MERLAGPVEEQHVSEELRPIGTVAQELDLTPRAIRYYEELGLIRPSVRVKGASRLYDPSDIERLRKIKLLREVVGFSLAEIAELLETEDMRAQLRTQFHGTDDPQVRLQVINEATELAHKRLAIIERKLAELQEMRAEELERLDRLSQVRQQEDQDDGNDKD
jgi:MerR family transcriptional regulator, repressor of the yfmOP operon